MGRIGNFSILPILARSDPFYLVLLFSPNLRSDEEWVEKQEDCSDAKEKSEV